MPPCFLTLRLYISLLAPTVCPEDTVDPDKVQRRPWLLWQPVELSCSCLGTEIWSGWGSKSRQVSRKDPDIYNNNNNTYTYMSHVQLLGLECMLFFFKSLIIYYFNPLFTTLLQEWSKVHLRRRPDRTRLDGGTLGLQNCWSINLPVCMWTSVSSCPPRQHPVLFDMYQCPAVTEANIIWTAFTRF